MRQYHIGLDIGSTACKGVLLSEDWVPVRELRATHPTIYPHQGWAEQEPQAWWRNTTRVLRKLGEDIPRDSVKSIGLSGQMEGPVLVDKEGKPLENCVIWLDTRASTVVKEYEKRIDLGWLYKTTGLRLNPMHTAMKLIWIRKNRRKVYDKAWKFLLPKDYIRYLLTGQMGTDISDASSTLLLDIKKKVWSEEAAKELGIHGNILPELHSSSEVAGELTPRASRATGLTRGTPVVYGGADTMCSYLGMGVCRAGDLGMTIGSSATAYLVTNRPVFHPQMQTICRYHVLKDRWFVGGGLSTAGYLLDWFLGVLGSPRTGHRGKTSYDLFDVGVEKVPAGSEGLNVLPYLMGARAPYWSPRMRGAICGLTLGHTRLHLMRAVLEGVCFGLKDIVECIAELKVEASELRVSGGVLKSRLLKRMLADVLDTPYWIPTLAASEAVGAALLGALGVGAIGDPAVAARELNARAEHCQPDPRSAQLYLKPYERHKVLSASLSSVGAM